VSDFNYTLETIEVLGSPMEVFLFRPEGEGTFPGIVLAQHIPVGHTGIEKDTFTLTTAQRLADNGYAVAVPFIFHWWPKSESMDIKKTESRDDWTLEDISAAFNVLAEQDYADRGRIAMVGHCWGGRVAWLAACHIRQFRALAVFYGGNIKRGLGVGANPPIDLAANIPCPVIGFFGNNDTNPSPVDVDDYSDALSVAGISHQFHQYEGVGHAFQNFPMPERYNEEVSENAWEKLIDFLDEHLRP
jgi:carboxymethylenebutenolidase